MKKIMCLLLVLMLSLVVLTACGTNTANNESQNESQQKEEIAWEDMERIEIYLPDFEDEWKKAKKDGDWLAFYERYKDKVLVFRDAKVTANHLSDHMKYLRAGQGGDGRYGSAHFFFDEEDKTDEIMNFSYGEKVVVEGILRQPEKTYAKPLDLEIEHTKLIEHSAWENPLYLSFDITPAFEETKAELLKKYSFVKNIEFSVKRVGKDGSMASGDDLRFVTDVEPGTDAKEVLSYADYAVRLLNENARKIDDTIAPSTGDSYGGLYKRHYLNIYVRPEGVVEAENKYYIVDVVTARVGNTIELQKAYR